MKSPLVSIIIVNWNGGKVLKDCLVSLSKIDYPKWELILVDNGSTDGSGARAEVKNTKNMGFAPANNQGVIRAKGKYVLLLNNDTVVPRKFLSIMVERMEGDQNVGAMQPKLKMMDKQGYLDNAGSFMTWIGFLKHWGFGRKDSSEFNVEREVFSAKGACLLIRKKVIDEVGLFDDDFVSYFEESDFCWRVWLAGYKVIYYPKTYILHKVGFTIKRLDVGNINFHYYKNRIAALVKNLGITRLLIILPVHLFLSLGISFIFLVRGKTKASSTIIKALVWNLKNIKLTLNKRKIIQSRRKISDNDLFPKLSRPVNLWQFFEDFKRVEKDINA